jgi:hypothetical protein
MPARGARQANVALERRVEPVVEDDLERGVEAPDQRQRA